MRKFAPEFKKYVLMRRFFCPLALLFAAVALLASCLNSDTTEYVTYDDVAITSFSIASAETTLHTTSSTGEDSTYTSTNSSLRSYKFVIDQAKAEIYNVDSLPANINAAKILVNCTTKNNGVALIRSIEKPDSVNYVSSTDTIDFSQPRTICVYSSSGLYSREYTVKVNVHKEDGDQMKWECRTSSAALAALDRIKGLSTGKGLFVLGVRNGQTEVYGSFGDGGRTWTLLAQLSENASENVVARNDSIFVLDGKHIKASVDGINFETLATDVPLKRLVAQSSIALYGINGQGSIISSEDAGKTWNVDEVDFGTEIPVRDISSCTINYPAVPNTECVVLTGNRDVNAYPADTAAVVMAKVVEKSYGSRKHLWSGVVRTANNYNSLPRIEHLTVTPYDGGVVAIGGKGIGECTTQPFAGFYKSVDFGFEWLESSDLTLPNGFNSSPTAFTMFSDDDNYLWIVCGSTGQVWRGRLNRLGWAD